MSAPPPPPVIPAPLKSIFQIVVDKYPTRKPGPITPGEFFGTFGNLITWIIEKCNGIDFAKLGTKPKVTFRVKLDHTDETERLLAEAISIDRLRALMEGYFYQETFNGAKDINPNAYGWLSISIPRRKSLPGRFSITLTRLNLA
ncbi:MAG: hypothetical protein QG568_511 [Patescibacteria group bacterium]|nr:hypothetical protein [Patescibacteria group bacterium]